MLVKLLGQQDQKVVHILHTLVQGMAQVVLALLQQQNGKDFLINGQLQILIVL